MCSRFRKARATCRLCCKLGSERNARGRMSRSAQKRLTGPNQTPTPTEQLIAESEKHAVRRRRRTNLSEDLNTLRFVTRRCPCRQTQQRRRRRTADSGAALAKHGGVQLGVTLGELDDCRGVISRWRRMCDAVFGVPLPAELYLRASERIGRKIDVVKNQFKTVRDRMMQRRFALAAN